MTGSTHEWIWFVGMLKGKAKLVLELIAAVVLTIFLAVMTYYAFGQLGKMLKISAMTATLHVPVYVFFAFIPIGFCGMTLRSLIHTILMVADFRSSGKADADVTRSKEGAEK